MPAIEVAVLQGLVDDMGGDMEVVRELIQSFLEEAPKLLVEGRAAALAGNVPDCQRSYHTLKSTAATFGAMQLSEAAKAIEHPAKSGVLPKPDMLDACDRLYAAAKAELVTRLA